MLPAGDQCCCQTVYIDDNYVVDPVTAEGVSELEQNGLVIRAGGLVA